MPDNPPQNSKQSFQHYMELPPQEFRKAVKEELQKGQNKSTVTIGDACFMHDQKMLCPLTEKRYNLLCPAAELQKNTPLALHRGSSGNPCACSESICTGSKTPTLLPVLCVQTRPLLKDRHLNLQSPPLPAPVQLVLDTAEEKKFQAVLVLSPEDSNEKDRRIPLQCISSFSNFPKRASVLCTRPEIGFCFPLPGTLRSQVVHGVYILDLGIPTTNISNAWDADWNRKCAGAIVGMNLRGTYVGLCPGRTYAVGFYAYNKPEYPLRKPPPSWIIKAKRDEWNPQSTAGPGRKARAREKDNYDEEDCNDAKKPRATPVTPPIPVQPGALFMPNFQHLFPKMAPFILPHMYPYFAAYSVAKPLPMYPIKTESTNVP